MLRNPTNPAEHRSKNYKAIISRWRRSGLKFSGAEQDPSVPTVSCLSLGLKKEPVNKFERDC